MKESIVKSYDELPLFLNAEMLAKALGVATSTAYELMHSDAFPTFRIGSRICVKKDHLLAWIDKEAGIAPEKVQ